MSQAKWITFANEQALRVYSILFYALGLEIQIEKEYC